MQQKGDFSKGLIRGQFISKMLLAGGKSLLDASRDESLWSEDSSKSGADTFYQKSRDISLQSGQVISKTCIDRLNYQDFKI